MAEHNDTPTQLPLGLARRGYTGVIQHLAAGQAGSALSDVELESRLIELGFVEGARVEVLYEGIIGAIRSRFASTTSPSPCAGAKRWPSSSPKTTGS